MKFLGFLWKLLTYLCVQTTFVLFLQLILSYILNYFTQFLHLFFIDCLCDLSQWLQLLL